MGDGMMSHINAHGKAMYTHSQEGHKTLLRMRCKDIYASLEESYIADASAAIASRLFELPEYAAAQTVFCYMSMPREVQTDAVIDRALRDGKRVCIPLCRGAGVMEAREYRAGDALSAGPYGIREPLEDAPVVPADEIDFAVIPCVACDRFCKRLGHGAGYYDRFLAETGFPKVALCFSKLIMTTIPVYKKTDVPMDVVVTETVTYFADTDASKVKHNGAV